MLAGGNVSALKEFAAASAVRVDGAVVRKTERKVMNVRSGTKAFRLVPSVVSFRHGLRAALVTCPNTSFLYRFSQFSPLNKSSYVTKKHWSVVLEGFCLWSKIIGNRNGVP